MIVASSIILLTDWHTALVYSKKGNVSTAGKITISRMFKWRSLIFLVNMEAQDTIIFDSTKYFQIPRHMIMKLFNNVSYDDCTSRFWSIWPRLSKLYLLEILFLLRIQTIGTIVFVFVSLTFSKTARYNTKKESLYAGMRWMELNDIPKFLTLH